jgi:hypothetical protein
LSGHYGEKKSGQHRPDSKFLARFNAMPAEPQRFPRIPKVDTKHQCPVQKTGGANKPTDLEVAGAKQLAQRRA